MKRLLLCTFLLVSVSNFVHGSGEEYKISTIEKAVNQAIKECSLNKEAEAARRFAYELYQVASDNFPKRNLFLAPSVVRMTLAMILRGAEGNTRSQIIDGIQFNEKDFSEDKLHCLFDMYSGSLDAESKGKEGSTPQTFAVKRVGRLFGEQSFAFDQDFIKKSQTSSTELERVDFLNETEETRNYINDWVEKATNNKIQDLFGEGDIGPDTKLAVASALYFRANWQSPFNAELTFNETFTLMGGETVTTECMFQASRFRYYRNDNYNVDTLELPYKEDPTGKYNISMILLVPDSMEDWQKNQFNLTEEYLGGTDGVLTKLLSSKKEMVRLIMPKFRLNADYNLKILLSEMGIIDMFSSSSANLSGMVNHEINTSPPLYVDSAIHKTFIKVNEKGTEAAGASGFSLVPLMLPMTLRITRPFFTIIYEQNAKEVLFIGRIMNPKATG